MIEFRSRVLNMIEAPNIIAATEVEPKNSRFEMQPVDYMLEGYTAFTNINQNGRGIIIWVHNSLDATQFNMQTNFQESLWVEITLRRNERLLCGCIYRSPNANNENNALLNDLMRETGTLSFTHLLVVGDFNYGLINWDLHSSPDTKAQNFVESCEDAFLSQHIRKRTRGRQGQQSNILDLVFSHDEANVSNIEHESPLGKSDHACILFDYFCTLEKDNSRTSVPIFRKANFQRIRESMAAIDWERELAPMESVQEMYDVFCTQYEEICSRHVPKMTFARNQRKRAPGINATEAAIIRKKHRAWTRYIETRSEAKYLEYARLRNKVKKVTRIAEKRHEAEIAETAKINPKRFWAYVKSRTKVKERIPDLIVDVATNQRTKDDHEKTETLSKFFASVFTDEPPGRIPTPAPQRYAETLETLEITPTEVEERLKKLKIDKARGPDGVHPWILRECASEISRPLCLIFKKSLSSGDLPKQWKQANISAIFKKGNKQLANNYRPVSLTCIPCKVMETILRKEIVRHMSYNSLFSPCQYGFMERRSTSLQLLHTIEDWLKDIDEGKVIDACYLDLMKAFDTVPHRRLLAKVKSYGIQGDLLEWIASFLGGREQTVCLSGCESRPMEVRSGVPQGSVLGPTLFVIYVNDMPAAVNSGIKLYADDAKLYRPVCSDIDRRALQKDIDALYSWSRLWLLKFHPEKCTMMRVGQGGTSDTDHYTMKTENGNTNLNWSTTEKDLGVMIDGKLTFAEEVRSRIKKGNMIVGTIRRTFTSLNESTFTQLFKALVRPHLEYAAVVWFPHLRRDIDAIEAVQRRATKQVPGLSQLEYPERLERLKLPSLTFRRKRGDMIEVFKIMTGLYHIDSREFFSINTQQTTRGHSRRILKPSCNTGIRLRSFAMRTINDWNALPEHVVTAENLNQFKNRLDKHWCNHPMLYNHRA